MAQDTAITRPVVAPSQSAESGKTNQVETDEGYDTKEVDKRYWERCLSDAERAEQNWRKRGREIVQIYRNDSSAGRSAKDSGNAYYNMLYANTEVLMPAVYAQPPQPVVRSRFIQARKLVPVMGPPPPLPAPPGVAQPGGPLAGPSLVTPPGVGPPPGAPPTGGPGGGAPPPHPMTPPPSPMLGAMPGGGMPPGLMPPGMAPSMVVKQPPGPKVEDIDTAAAVIEKALEIVVQEEISHEAVKTAVKDVLLPGRGVCRVRWNPVLKQQNKTGPDGMPLMGAEGPITETIKIWETTNTEYVYWEDFLIDPVRQHTDARWCAFRHLFTGPELKREFKDTEELQQLIAEGKLDTLLVWTEESAAKSPPSGGGYSKTAGSLGNAIKKAMVWEIWDKTDPDDKRVIWFIRESGGMVLRIDPDSLGLANFFPIPQPILSIFTSDTRIPKPYFDQYSRLAADIEETSVRSSGLTKQIKVRGGYNSASTEIADILKADDQKMIPVDGVDMINGGLQNHLWLLPINEWMQALDKLLMARESQKTSVYEVMGISDIMRGATRASETATAQRIKGSMGAVRLQELKNMVANFARDLMALMAEVICKNFDPDTLTRMTGEEVTPAVMAILRDNFTRTCKIDIETDSTVLVDEQTEQQSMAQVIQAFQAVLGGTVQLAMSGVLPTHQALQLGLEVLRMALHPIRQSRGVVELLDDFKEQLNATAALSPPAPMGTMPGGPPKPPPPPQPKAPGGPPMGAGPRPGTVNGGPKMAPPQPGAP